ncbi:MAG: ATP-dependent Clp protease ATP-binding subunit [Patescibacteria group bacterium]
MPEITTPTAVLCSTCNGDPRLSPTCKACGGAGVGVPSTDGFLVWSQPVDDFSIALRKTRRGVRTIFHLALLAFGLLALVLFAWQVSLLNPTSQILAVNFWAAGHWFVTLFWIGLFVDCFLVFRLMEFSKETKPIPNWGKTKTELVAQEKTAASRANVRFEVGTYFSPSAMDVVEDAYKIAKSLRRTEVTPSALFAAAIASSSGGLFMVRLGLTFENVKGPLARVLSNESGGQPPIALSRDSKRTLALAYADARNASRKFVSPIEIFLQSFKDSMKIQEMLDQMGFPPEHVVRVAEWIRMEEQMREDHERFTLLAALKPSTAMNRAMTARQTPLLDRFSEDLTLAARNGYLAAIVGREKEMDELLRGIESGRRSIALVGETGVGKTAIVEQLARRMVEEDVPPELFDRRLVSVDIARVIAAGDPALASDRLVSILQEVALSGNIILVIHGAEALSGTGTGGPMDLLEILASELDKGYQLAILTTTPRAWTQYIERRSLGAKLVKVNVPELDADDTLRVLMARGGYIEYQSKAFFSFAALDKAATLATRYIHDKAAPENALDVIREAATLARKARGERTFVTADDVAKVVHDKTDIPVETITQSETNKLLSLEDHLHGRVIGQDEAVTAVAQALRRARAQLREGKRPIANFLFLGPTGVGKTELSKALAAEYFGSENAMIRLDMSEYQDKSSIVRVIGAPGDERGGLLTEAVRQKPFSLILLDELEKANPDILNLFLQVMDDGRLTDGVGRTIDFTNTMLIMTSNAGTPYIQAEVSKGTPIDRIKTGLLEQELKGIFRPEFLNRFDGVIVFKPLTMDDVTQIAWLLVNGIAKRLEAERGIKFIAEDTAVEELAVAGFDPLFGARPLRRVIQERVDNALADLVLRGEVGRKDTIRLQPGGTLTVQKAPRM